jgi:hypothetical protein
LSIEQYHAIAVYVFSLNGRPADKVALPSTALPRQAAGAQDRSLPTSAFLLAGIVPLAALLALIITRRDHRSG